jgi:hypothetical protein
VEGSLIADGQTPRLRTARGGVVALPGLKARASDERRVVLGARSEHVIALEPSAADAVGRAMSIERTGADCFIALDFHGARFSARGRPDFTPGPDGEVGFRIDGGAVSLFCPTSGDRLEEGV